MFGFEVRAKSIKDVRLRMQQYSRECQHDGLRVVDIDTLVNRYRQRAKITGDFPVLGLI